MENINYSELTVIIVRTQEELDIIPLDFKGRIIIEGEKNNWIVIKNNYYNSVTILENSSVIVRGNSSVAVWGNSTVVAFENSSVTAYENSSVWAWGNSFVEACGKSTVVAWENSSVRAYKKSTVRAYGNVRVVDFGAKIQIYDNAIVFRERFL